MAQPQADLLPNPQRLSGPIRIDSPGMVVGCVRVSPCSIGSRTMIITRP